MSLKSTVENIVASGRCGSSLRAGMHFSLLFTIEEMFNSPQKNLFIEILEAVLFEFRRVVQYREEIGQQTTDSEYAIEFKRHMVRIQNRKELYKQYEKYDWTLLSLCRSGNSISPEMLDELSWFKTGLMFETKEKSLFFQIIDELIDTFAEQ